MRTSIINNHQFLCLSDFEIQALTAADLMAPDIFIVLVLQWVISSGDPGRRPPTEHIIALRTITLVRSTQCLPALKDPFIVGEYPIR